MSSYFYDRLTEPKDSSSKILPRESEKDHFYWTQVPGHIQLPMMFFSIHKICYFDVCCPDMCIL